MPPKRIIESFFTASTKRNCQHVANETAADEREVGGGGGRLIKMECLILFSAPPPYLFRSAAVVERQFMTFTVHISQHQ